MFAKMAYNSIAVVVTTIAAILTSVVLARTLGPEAWGVYAQANWVITLGANLVSSGLILTAIRFLGTYSLDDDASERASILSWVVVAQIALIMPGCLLLLLYSPQVNRLMGWHMEPHLFQLSALGLVALAVGQMGVSILRGLQAFRSVAIASTLIGLMTLGTIPIVLRYPEVWVLLLASAAGQLLLIPVYVNLARRHAGPGQRAFSLRLPTAWRTMLRYLVVITLTSLVDMVVWSRSEVFFLGRLSDPSQTAYYSLAFTITGTVLATVSAAITGTLVPVFSSSADVEGQPREHLPGLYQQSFSLLNWIVLPSAVGFAIVGPTAILTFYGEAYTPVIPVLYLVILSSTLAVYARPSSSVLHAINKPLALLSISLAVLPLNLLLAWYLVPKQGAVGAALANLAAQALGASILILYATRTASLRYGWRSIGKNLLAAMGCGLVAQLVISSINEPLVAMLIAIVVGAIVYYLVGLVLKDTTTHAIGQATVARLATMIKRPSGLQYKP